VSIPYQGVLAEKMSENINHADVFIDDLVINYICWFYNNTKLILLYLLDLLIIN